MIKVSQVAVTSFNLLSEEDYEWLLSVYPNHGNSFIIVTSGDIENPESIRRKLYDRFKVFPDEMVISKDHPQIEFYLIFAKYEVDFGDNEYILRFF